ncbi:DUF7848 domain-containing protein [Streptomyces sp. NPDC002402]
MWCLRHAGRTGHTGFRGITTAFFRAALLSPQRVSQPLSRTPQTQFRVGRGRLPGRSWRARLAWDGTDRAIGRTGWRHHRSTPWRSGRRCGPLPWGCPAPARNSRGATPSSRSTRRSSSFWE